MPANRTRSPVAGGRPAAAEGRPSALRRSAASPRKYATLSASMTSPFEKAAFWSRCLEPDSGNRDPRVDGPVDRTIIAGRRIAQEQRVAHGGVESIADQPLLLPLEGL